MKKVVVFRYVFTSKYGIKNILTRNGYSLYDNIIVIINAFKNRIKCSDWELLFTIY